MADWSPPKPSSRITTGAAVCWLFVLAYALIALGNPLLGLLPGLFLLAGYYAWRLLAAVEAIADGLQRLAAARERSEADGQDGAEF